MILRATGAEGDDLGKPRASGDDPEDPVEWSSKAR